jgi:hypothetical protein
MEIAAVTINMSGRRVLGVTPKYKVDMVETFLKSLPDLIFLQVDHAPFLLPQEMFSDKFISKSFCF